MRVPAGRVPERFFVRGSILRARLTLSAATKEKFLLIVTRSPEDDQVWFLLPTSHADRLIRFRSAQDYLLLRAGCLPMFPKQTLILCEEAHCLPRRTIIEMYDRAAISYQGQFPTDLLLELDGKLQATCLLSPKTKAAIVP